MFMDVASVFDKIWNEERIHKLSVSLSDFGYLVVFLLEDDYNVFVFFFRRLIN